MGTAQQQGQIWGARAADWAAASEPAWTGIFETVMEKVGAGPGLRLLDIGCGAGGALAIARRRGAEISGLDAAPALVSIARDRLPAAVIEVGEMEELPFHDGRFDVVTAINSFQFAGDIGKALAEAARVTRPRGTVAMMVWGRREDCDLLGKVMPAVFALLPSPPAGAPQPLPLAEAGVIEALMASAGLTPRASEMFDGGLEFPDLNTAVTAILSASARAIAHAGEPAVRAAVESALERFAQRDGSLRLANRFRLALATRP